MIRGLIPFKEHERVLRVVLALLHTALPIVCVTALSTSRAKPSVTDEPRLGRQERIEELMQKAFEAEDLAEQKEYYSEILGLDSSDQIALERLKEIEAKLEQRRKREKSTQLQHEMREPPTKEKLDLGDKKEREAIEVAIGALSYDNLEQLKAVKQRIEDVLQVNPDSARLQNMRTTLEERISSKENLSILRNTLLALLAVSALYLLCFFLLRKKRAFLQLIHDPKQVFMIDKDKVSLGALEGKNDLVIHDEGRRISRFHCQILRSGTRFYICDISANGTKINGHSIERQHPVKLQTGDQISLAGAVVLSFQIK